MTDITKYDEHACEINTVSAGRLAVDIETLKSFDLSKHEHGAAACGCCGCCFTGDCCGDVDCVQGKECEAKDCHEACRENNEHHDCAFCHLAFDTDEQSHEEILKDLRELSQALAA
ncbi:MAG: lectin-C [Bifidobacterium psychraerophilum]|uniref:lectin-C n=1 Tax=Bifidobacterium psychraerophilum TaxID=218140 RepID=UPI0039EC4B75